MTLQDANQNIAGFCINKAESADNTNSRNYWIDNALKHNSRDDEYLS